MSALATKTRADASLPTAEQLRRAADAIRGIAARTPLAASGALSDLLGAEVRLKLETRQPTRSFKLRGATNAIAALARDGTREVVAASAGNHGAGVAYAARVFGLAATVFVPAAAPASKRRRIGALGARLRLVEGDYDVAEAAGQAHAADAGVAFVHPFDDPAVVAGQGTIGLEILEDWPDAQAIVVPVGGGGLAAGVGAALTAADGSAALLGVQSVATRAMHDAFRAGHPVPYEESATLADGLAGGVSETSCRRARAVMREITLVSEAELEQALRHLLLREGVLAEGSGAVGVAALLAGRLPTLPTAIVVTGGNVDAAVIGRVLAEV